MSEGQNYILGFIFYILYFRSSETLQVSYEIY